MALLNQCHISKLLNTYGSLLSITSFKTNQHSYKEGNWFNWACLAIPTSTNWIFSATGDLQVSGSFIFVDIGGLRLDTLDNDISLVSNPKEIFKGIWELVQDFENTEVTEVCNVYISEILKRVCGQTFPSVSPHDIHCPRDYLEDLRPGTFVIPIITKKTWEIQKYFHCI